MLFSIFLISEQWQEPAKLQIGHFSNNTNGSVFYGRMLNSKEDLAYLWLKCSIT